MQWAGNLKTCIEIQIPLQNEVGICLFYHENIPLPHSKSWVDSKDLGFMRQNSYNPEA